MKEKNKENIVTALRAWKWFWLGLGVIVLTFFLLLFLVALFADIPSGEEIENPKRVLVTQVLSEDGQVLSTFQATENRMLVRYDEISPNVIHAAVATEDARFYEHSGIDFSALGRVAFKTILLFDRSQGGGSTITQQVAKNLFKTRQNKKLSGILKLPRMLWVKMSEWVTAIRLERDYTKDEIITMYLNTVEFGSNSHGIKVAARTFFGKDPSDLNIEESALLVGMVNAPTRYNPVLNPERALQRRNTVIGRMYDADYITKAERDSLRALPITLNYQVQNQNSGLAPYFKDMLRSYMSAGEPDPSKYTYRENYSRDSLRWADDPLYGWLNKNFKPDGSKYSLGNDGLRIYTTINYRMQKYAEEAVAEHLGKDLQKSFYNDLRWKTNRPFSNDVPKETIEGIMKRARQNSDRWRAMKKGGAGDKEILSSFKTPVKMRVFTWKSPGYIDTTMTPDDSIKYYKSFLRAAFMAIEPGTGHVKAYVGGPNYRYFKYDNIRQGERQVGSTIKPFLYTLAMQGGMTPCDKTVCVPQTFIVGDNTWTPRSTDKDEWIGRTVTLKWGLTHSSNNISAYLMKQFGPEAMVDMMRQMGISSHIDAVPAICVGSPDLSISEMVAAYNTFPSQGVYTAPLFVTRIEDNQGNLLSEFTHHSKEAISRETAYLMINLMQGVVNNGTAARLRSKYQLKGQIAGKTGTTNDNSDGWFIGYTPSITAGVWVGGEDRQIHFQSLALGGGSNMALPIWGLFMQKCLKDGTLGISEADVFVKPTGMNLDLNCDGGDGDLESASAMGAEYYFD